MPFKRDMQRGKEADWVPVAGNWDFTCEFSDYGWSVDSKQRQSNRITIGSDKWDDYMTRTKISPVNMKNDSSFGLLMRYLDENNYYLCEYVRETRSLAIRKMRNGVMTTLAMKRLTSTSWTVDEQRYRYMAVAEAEGNQITFYMDYGMFFNSAESVTIIDNNSPIPAGKTGLSVNGEVKTFFSGIMTAHIFSDRFANSSKWRAESGNWIINNGYRQSDTTVNEWKISTAGETYWSDQELIVRIKEAAFSGRNAKVAAISHFIDRDNYYRYEIDSGGSVNFVKRVRGAETEIAKAVFPVTNNIPYTITVRMDKNLFKIYINGLAVLSSESYETALPSGKIGIGTFGTSVNVDLATVNSVFMLKSP